MWDGISCRSVSFGEGCLLYLFIHDILAFPRLFVRLPSKMSPPETYHHTPRNDGHDAHDGEVPMSLEDYAITRNGFLPEEPPVTRLPSVYYAPWESIMDTLSDSLTNRTLRSQVDQLPVLSTKLLAAEPEWRRAYLILTFLAHAYIWGGDVASEVTSNPPRSLISLEYSP